MSNFYLVTGLPNSGQEEFFEVLAQCLCHTDGGWFYNGKSVLPKLLNDVSSYDMENTFSYQKFNILKAIYNGYLNSAEQEFKYIFENSEDWVSMIGFLKNITEKPIKMLCFVRNPAEIIATFEKRWKESLADADAESNPIMTPLNSSIMSRAFSHASPSGALGKSHTAIRDAITMGQKDSLLFVDYNRFCNSPKSQMKRIFDFFELDFDIPEKIQLKKDTINCVEHLGLDLYQQYNAQIFWDAWI